MDTKWMRALAAVGMTVAVTFGTVGCENEGPAEEVGEAIDDAADDAGDNLEEAADEVEDAIDRNN